MNPILNLTPSPVDLRDYPYVPPDGALPPAVDLRPYVYEIEDQSTRGTCASNAIPSACELLKYRAGNPADLSRLFLDYNTRLAEGRLSEEGVAISDALKSARHEGLPAEALWPYDLAANWNVKPPQPVYDEAIKTTLRRYEAIVGWTDATMERAERISRIKSALYEGLPVVIGLVVGAQIRTITGPLANHVYGTVGAPGNERIGGHAVVIVGYDDSLGMFIVQNSWGAFWGDNGYWGLGYDHVLDPFFEAWAVRGFADAEIREPAGIKLELINRYRIEARIVPEFSEIGTVTNIWIGAVIGGAVYLKKPDTDEWFPANGTYPPTHQNFLLSESNFVQAVKWTNLEAFAGTDVYIAYGLDVLTWKLSKICTVPAFSS